MRVLPKDGDISQVLPKSLLTSAGDDIVVFDFGCIKTPENLSKGIAVTRSLAIDEVICEMHNRGFKNAVDWGNPNFASEIELATKFINAAETLPTDIRSRVLSHPNAESLIFPFTKSDQKSEFLDRAKDFFAGIDRLGSRQDEALTICDELFTNALYNAPDSSAKVSRTEHVTVKTSKPATITIERDANTLLIRCHDLYGTLNTTHLLSRLHETYSLGKGQSIQLNAKGGAGIGFRMIIDMCQSIYIYVKPKQETIIFCALSLKRLPRFTPKIGKTIHMT